jgi:hypothetical protein
MHDDQQTDLGYGSNRYIWIDGVRHKRGFTTTVPPMKHESRAAFEWRMNNWAERLAALPNVASFEIEIKLTDGKATMAIVHVTLAEPELAPLGADDDTPTGRGSPRGGRGGRGGGGTLNRMRERGYPVA